MDDFFTGLELVKEWSVTNDTTPIQINDKTMRLVDYRNQKVLQLFLYSYQALMTMPCVKKSFKRCKVLIYQLPIAMDQISNPPNAYKLVQEMTTGWMSGVKYRRVY